MRAFGIWLKGEISGWKSGEYAWLIFCCAAITGLSLWQNDTWLGIVSSVTGTLYALFAGKGRISCYFFGIVNTLGYSWISYSRTLYGEVMLNLGWYFPMMFAGIFFWRRHLNREHSIVKTHLDTRGRIAALLLSLSGIAGYALILKRMGDQSPVLDSITTILSITAMVLTVKRCIEQWLLWIAVNCVSIYMWLLLYLKDGDSFATLLMWCIALANGVIFFRQWHKETAKCPET